MSVSLRGWRLLALMVLMAPVIAACANNHGHVKRAAFTSKEFGVAVSPRVFTGKYPPRGGGRQMPANPYVVRGVTYKPVDGPGYVATGEASWYGQDFHGRRTANGEIFGAYYLTAASPVLPIPSYARVTNLENGRSVLVRINDRGPYAAGRVIDLSRAAADRIGLTSMGIKQVALTVVDREGMRCGGLPVEAGDVLASATVPAAPQRARSPAPARRKAVVPPRRQR